MEPFARLGIRPRFRPSPGSGRSKSRSKHQAKPEDKRILINVLGMLSNLKMSMNRLLFYRQRGQR